MEQHLDQEWEKLESQARTLISHPPPQYALMVRVHAVVLPSFRDSRAYSLLVAPNAPGQVLGVSRVWRRGVDRAKFESASVRLTYGEHLEPTIEERRASVRQDAVNDILGRAAELNIPAWFRETTMGCDGESYVLAFEICGGRVDSSGGANRRRGGRNLRCCCKKSSMRWSEDWNRVEPSNDARGSPPWQLQITLRSLQSLDRGLLVDA